jgi:flagellar FliL protein
MADNDAAAPAAGGNKKMIIIIAAVAVLMLAVGGGAAFFLLGSGGGEATEEAAPEVVLGVMEYMDLSPAFIVSFPFQGRQRYLQASLTIMSRDAEAMAAVTEHMPIIRHNLLNLLTAQMLGVAESPQPGIENLRNLATAEVKAVLHQEIGRDGIDQVIFTAFVMQ